MNNLAEVLLDSIPPYGGARLTTMVVKLPKSLVAEINTHRDFSRNSASSRAIPVKKIIDAVIEDPYIPDWGIAKQGMQDGGVIENSFIRSDLTKECLSLRDRAVETAQKMLNMGASKQDINYYLMPWQWTTIIVSSTRWENFFEQRCALNEEGQPQAHRAFYKTACAMRSALEASTPTKRYWHMPFVTEEEIESYPHPSFRALLSAARCARVSYLNHDKQYDLQKDIATAKKLLYANPSHPSPFEHSAECFNDEGEFFRSNFNIPWVQYRHLMYELRDYCHDHSL